MAISISRRCILTVCYALWLAASAVTARAQIVLDDILFVPPRPASETKFDTLLDLARAFGLGFTEAAAANPGVDPWSPADAEQLTIPRAHILPEGLRRGIVINLPEQRLFFFKSDGGVIFTAPVGTGVSEAETPIGSTTIIGKRINPTWYPPASIRARRPELPRVVPPGPDNPLGSHALDLGWRSYAIHGTNNPWSVGRRATSGCIRLYPEHIRILFELVSVGVPVRVVDQPIKVGWLDGQLWMEAHPSQRQALELEETGGFSDEPVTALEDLVSVRSSSFEVTIDWAVVKQALQERRGIPVQISH